MPRRRGTGMRLTRTKSKKSDDGTRSLSVAEPPNVIVIDDNTQAGTKDAKNDVEAEGQTNVRVAERKVPSRSCKTPVKVSQGRSKGYTFKSSTPTISPVIKANRNYGSDFPFGLRSTPEYCGDDDFLQTQSEQPEIEIGWNNSPRTSRSYSTGVDITEVLRKCSEYELASEVKPAGSPGFENMWTAPSPPGDFDDNLCIKSYMKVTRGKISKRGRSRLHGLRRKINTKELLQKLAAVVGNKPSAPKSKEIEDDKEENSSAVRRSDRLKGSTSEEECLLPTDKSAGPLFSSESDTDTHMSRRNDIRIINLNKKELSKIDLNDKLSTKDTLSNKSNTEAIVESTAKGDIVSTEDELWTDEELFDSDSFLTATQQLLEQKSPDIERKRKHATSTPNVTPKSKKTSRYTFQLDSNLDSSAAYTVQVESKKANASIKQPSLGSSGKLKPSTILFTNNAVQETKNSMQSKFQPNKISNQHQNGAKCVQKPAFGSTIANASPKLTIVKPSTVPNNAAQETRNSMQSKFQPNKIFNQHQNGTKCVPQPTLGSANANARTKLTTVKPSTVSNDIKAGQIKGKFTCDQNESLTDDILAALAEPDEILDSQSDVLDDSFGNERSKKEESQESGNFVKVPVPFKPKTTFSSSKTSMPPPAVKPVLSSKIVKNSSCGASGQPSVKKNQSNPITKNCDVQTMKTSLQNTNVNTNTNKGNLSDEDDDLLAEEQLLAILDAAESQALPAAATKPSSAANVTLDISFNPISHSTQVGADLQPSTKPPLPLNKSNQPVVFTASKPQNRTVNPVPNVTQKIGNSVGTKIQPKTLTSVPNAMKTIGKPAVSNSINACAQPLTGSLIASSSSSSSSNSSEESLHSQYSKEEIERKRQEALKKRLNRLKLSKKNI